jgi:hypothetical protein
MAMPKAENDNGTPVEELNSPPTAPTSWESLLAEVIAKDNELLDDEILADAIGVDAEDEDDVIAENDDNPYQESDEALPDDDEERDIERQLRDE